MQIRPRACRAMKLMISGVTFSAAHTRSPSFSRSSSSMMMIIRPSRMSRTASSMVAIAMRSYVNRKPEIDKPSDLAVLNQTFNILRDNVDFEIHAVAGLQVRQVGDLPGLRDDRDLEILVRQVRNRQTDALYGNRTFVNQITADLPRKSDANGPRLAVVLNALERAARVD